MAKQSDIWFVLPLCVLCHFFTRTNVLCTLC